MGGQSLRCPASLPTRFATPLPGLMVQHGLGTAVHTALVGDHIGDRERALGNHHCHGREDKLCVTTASGQTKEEVSSLTTKQPYWSRSEES